jgi:hypothetical protein
MLRMHHEVNQRGKKYKEVLIVRNSINSNGYHEQKEERDEQKEERDELESSTG